MTSATRSIIVEQAVQAPPSAVWAALTVAEELMRWFPSYAEIDARPGGIVKLSWGEGAEGSAPIHALESERHFGWTEQHGEIQLAVDFYIEARGSGTVVRLVHSGFGSGEDWDEQYHMVEGGWSYFLHNLKHYLERHPGVPRELVAFREAVQGERGPVWTRLLAALDGSGSLERAAAGDRIAASMSSGYGWRGEVLLVRPPYQLAFTIESLNDALVLLELEPAEGGCRPGLWISTYGADPSALADARVRIGEAYRGAVAG